MITKDELKNYAKQVSLNLAQAEKDYFQNIILFILYQSHGKDIIFKGGTALKKCYGLNRFSEDLDFTCPDTVDVRTLEEGLRRFRIDFELDKKDYKDGLKITLHIKGPLHIGIRQSLCKFIIDFSYRENVITNSEIKTIGRFMEETPSFDVVVMSEKEIAAEKVRAILTRTKARDVYDLYFLLQKGVSLDVKLIEKKLEYYNLKWSSKEFMHKLNEKKEIWKSELNPLIANVPDFKEVKKCVMLAVEMMLE